MMFLTVNSTQWVSLCQGKAEAFFLFLGNKQPLGYRGCTGLCRSKKGHFSPVTSRDLKGEATPGAAPEN